MDSRRPNHDGSNVLEDRARDEPGKKQGDGVHPGFIWEKVGELAHKRRATGEGETSRERKKARVICTTFGVTVAESYLKAHMARSHGIRAPRTRGVDEVG